MEGHVRAQIQQLEPILEQQNPQSLEPQLPLVPTPPAPQPPRARTAPEERTSGSAPSIGSPPPARQIIPYTEMSVAVQGWDTATKGKQLKQPKKSQKGKAKAKGQVYKSQREQLNAIIQVPDHYVWTKPFLSEADLAEKTMSMKRFHTWYLKACDLGLTHVLARLPSECFRLAGDHAIFIGF